MAFFFLLPLSISRAGKLMLAVQTRRIQYKGDVSSLKVVELGLGWEQMI